MIRSKKKHHQYSGLFYSFSAICFFLLFLGACTENKTEDEVSSIIQEIKEAYAPDKRVAIWDIQADGNQITGETDQPEALEELKNRLDAINYVGKISVKMLPEPDLGEETQAVVTISVANIRSAPKHSAELATQALMGTPVKVLKKEGGWYLIQTPDGYISWVDAAGIALKDKATFADWQQSKKIIFTELNGFVFAAQDKKSWISDLVAGNILEVLEESKGMYRVMTPDGREGWIPSTQAMDFEDWKNSRDLNADNLINTAKSMMGSPYLWGGTSIKGIDCSGFTKTVFFLNGQVIPRDASQQIHEGDLVDDNQDWSKLEVGDLLFFGEKATADRKERIIHVGMWIGNNSFIHSRGLVRISSFDPESPDYDEYELNRYIRTKRVIGKDNPNITSVENTLKFPTL